MAPGLPSTARMTSLRPHRYSPHARKRISAWRIRITLDQVCVGFCCPPPVLKFVGEKAIFLGSYSKPPTRIGGQPVRFSALVHF
eukprot:3931274-Rhodomonas_salina.3